MQKRQQTLILGWIVWVLGSCFFLTEYFVRVSTGVLSSYLLQEFHASATAVGLLSAYFYYAYITMQIPVGILVDRFGVRNLLSLATISFGSACILFSFMTSLELGYIARFIMGLVGAFAFVGTLKLITVYFPANRFALLSGITQSLGMVGAIIGAAPMANLFDKIGWRASFTGFGTLFIGLGVVMYILIRDVQEEHHATDNKIQNSIISDLKTVVLSSQTWLNCLFIGLMYAPTEVFGEQWGTLFGSTADNINIESAALQVSFIFMGMAIGCPLVGYISDQIQSRIKVMRICSVACFVLILFMIYSSVIGVHLNYSVMCAVMFLYGIFNSAIIPSYAVATEIHTKKVSGMALGITNMATVIGGAVFIPLIGYIIDLLNNNNHAPKVGDQLHLTIHDFHIGFIMLPICFIICFLLTFVIKETSCKSTD